MCVWLLAACFGAYPIHAMRSPYYGRPVYIVTPTGLAPIPTISPSLTTITTTPPRPNTLPPLTPVPSSFPLIDPRGATLPSLRIGEQDFDSDSNSVNFPRSKREAAWYKRRKRDTVSTTPSSAPIGNPTLTTLTPLNINATTVPSLITTTMSIKVRDVEELTISRQVPTQNDGVIIFPREKRSTTSNTRNKRQTNCGCLVGSICPNTNTSNGNFGAGQIDFRIVNNGGTPTIVNPSPNPNQCPAGFVYCCTGSSPQLSCGSRVANAQSFPIQSGQARYGDYPWMVVILTNENLYVGGGVLIDNQHVLTTTHRIASYPNGVGLKVRLGEWDASGVYEPFPFRDSTILRVWNHESFNPSTLQNGISLIRMATAVPVSTAGIIPICMPTTGQVFDGLRCWVSGWGRDSFSATGQFQAILKAVDVPVVPQTTCESTFKTTRLGPTFTLDRASFICAGGELNKDACTGDGGSGLVCETAPGRWTLAGLVAWGIGCATQGIPAAYINIVNYLPWILPKLTAL